ncbi:MAG: hypothetical protein K0M49_04110 [Arenimonas sp.]|nr:hypothetical protein [Rhizobium sp.]MBW8444794.1 hypothetical protein [Arenimonas sp.]
MPTTHKSSWRARLAHLSSIALALGLTLGAAGPALALSDIPPLPAPQQDPAAPQQPVEGEETEDLADPGPMGIPDPDPLINKPANDLPPVDAQADPDQPPPEVIYDLSKVPEPVRRMRELLIEAATSGDIERLRILMNPGPNQTRIVLESSDADPVAALKQLSGDEEGIEILAILIDILSTGFVRVDAGTPDEAYVWPYFAEKPLALLTLPEKVELLRIVTAGDVAEMQELGNYNFFRLGISPDGQWKFLTAGD